LPFSIGSIGFLESDRYADDRPGRHGGIAITIMILAEGAIHNQGDWSAPRGRGIKSKATCPFDARTSRTESSTRRLERLSVDNLLAAWLHRDAVGDGKCLAHSSRRPLEGSDVSNPLSSHPRIAIKNPLVDQLQAGADPKTVVPDDAIIVRGGRDYHHQEGSVISAQMGSSIEDAASGLPHGTVRVSTAGHIRAAGGTIELMPEPAWEGGPDNTWHVNVTEGLTPVFPGEGIPSPVPNQERLKLPK
jgi:hypothetical protein